MSDRTERPIGDALNALGITADIGEGTLVAGAVVLLKTVLPDGTIRLSLAHSEGLGWIERAGMLHLATAMETATVAGATEPGA